MEFNKELSYKELCKLFNEPEKQGGKNRENQLKRLNKTYEIEKNGRKYIILRKKTPEEIQLDSDKEHYSKYLQTVLLNMIADNPEITMTFTYRQIRENLMMVNSHYFPNKYCKENVKIKLPYNYNPDEAYFLERQWLDIADKHDSASIKYVLKVLKAKCLITSLQETYVFYKFERALNGTTIYHAPVIATEEQKAEINQRQLDYIKENISKERIDEIEKETNAEDFLGKCLNELFKKGPKFMEHFYAIPNEYAKEIGYTRYATGFTITRPTELKKVVDYFSPKFNELQVTRYLNSSRFKTIPPFIHQQLTDKLIKV